MEPDRFDDAYSAAVDSEMRRARVVVPPRLRDAFTLRYVFALLLVGGLTIVAGLSGIELVEAQSTAAAEVNVSGRQRMLSQRIALQTAIYQDATPGSREKISSDLRRDIDAMESAQSALIAGDPSRNLPGDPSVRVAELYDEGTRVAVEDFVASARAVIDPSRADAERTASAETVQSTAAGSLLPQLDAIVRAYQEESERQVASITTAELIVLFVTLLVLLLEALFVFRPMSRRIALERGRLTEAATRHRAEAERHAFGLRLRNAVDLADTEAALIDVIHQAHRSSRASGEAQVLLTDRHHLQSLNPASGEQGHGCSVRTVGGCPALRSGRRMDLTEPDQLGGCAHFRRDAETSPAEGLGSTCVPIAFLGSPVGVLRDVTAKNRETGDLGVEDLETIARTVGSHVGTLRALATTREDAERDPLTGLLNRRGLEKAVAELHLSGAPYVVAVVDLDHFKEINDTHGHDRGDQVLGRVAEVMTSVLRPGDILARHGGEEFVVVAPLRGEGLEPGNELAAGVAIAERIRARIAAGSPGDVGPACTASVGVAGPFTADFDGALRRADAALYRAKDLGRNRVEIDGDLLGEIGPALLAEIGAPDA